MLSRLIIQMMLTGNNALLKLNNQIPQPTQQKIAQSATFFLSRAIKDKLEQNQALQDQGARLTMLGWSTNLFLFSSKQHQKMQDSTDLLLKKQLEKNDQIKTEEISPEQHPSSKRQAGQ